VTILGQPLRGSLALHMILHALAHIMVFALEVLAFKPLQIPEGPRCE